MNEIIDLLKKGESETVEFKSSLSQMGEIMRSISAFSNTKGGRILIGVSDKGKVLGVDVGKRTIESLANMIKQNTDPIVYPSIYVEEINDKRVVIIEVNESKQKPVLASGRAYRRVGKSNQKLGYEKIRNLVLEASKVYWDEIICEEAESIINALIHRNYFEPADTRVAIFDDRVEVISPGSFPKGVTPEKPKHVPVNPILCQLMYDVGFIEKYGSGIYMINELCEEWGIPKPEYNLSEVETKVIFRSSGKAIVINEIEKIGVELNERQREGLKIIFERGKITNTDYAKMFKISRNTATNDLSGLIRKGLIKRVGRGRGSYYAPKI